MKPLHRGGDGLLGLVWRNLVPPNPSIGTRRRCSAQPTERWARDDLRDGPQTLYPADRSGPSEPSRSRIFGRAQGGIRSLACRPLGHAPAAQPVSAGDATTGVAATATGGTVVVVVVVVLA